MVLLVSIHCHGFSVAIRLGPGISLSIAHEGADKNYGYPIAAPGLSSRFS
jgi:hypothetical protein